MVKSLSVASPCPTVYLGPMPPSDSSPLNCRLDCLQSDGTPHPKCPVHGDPPTTDPLAKCVDIDPAVLKCPTCGHVATRTPHADAKGTQNLQRCRYCGHVALWSTFKRLTMTMTTPSP